jgi:hypothetical protein|tara:strand:+ start:6830 stop:9376 length:2547 start_codon:yes stop_codon:yes gene_type:complete
MTVSSSTSKVSFSGNGSLTTFAYSFKIFDQDDLTVILRAADGTETVQTITTHYTVTGVGSASGGNVVFGTAPASGVTVVILREQPLTQGLDLVANDPFPAESLEEALDKLVFMTQKHEEELSRAIKGSRTNVISNSEFTVSATDRANKLFSFDSSGNLSIAQELGTFRGNWATSTSYNARDLVKDTSTNNIFLVNTAHTSSGSQPLTTNANSAKYDLIVDAASATTAQTAAAASATAAAASETASAASETASAASQAAAATSATNSANSATASAASATSAAASFDDFDDRYLGAKSTSGGNPTTDNDGNALIDGALFFDTTNNVLMVYNLGTTTWLRTTPTSSDQTAINAVNADATDIGLVAGSITNVNNVGGDITNVNTVAGQISPTNNISTVAGISSAVSTVAGDTTAINALSAVTTEIGLLGVSSVITDMGILGTADAVADMAILGTSDVVADMAILGTSANVTAMSNVSGSISNVNTVANNLTSVNSFGNQYVVSASAPSSPTEGLLWFDTSTDTMKVYNGSSFQNAGSSVNGTTDRSNYVVGTSSGSYTGSTTVFPATYDAGFLDVYLNGVRLDPADFTATNGTSVTLGSAATSGDIVGIVGYGTFELADHYNKTNSDARYAQLSGATFTGDISGTNATLSGYLRGPSTFTIDPATHGDNTGTLVVAGNLQVDGTTSTINSTTLTVDDLNVVVASGAANAAAANGAGLTVDGASATFNYASTGDKWTMNKPLDVTGAVTATSFSGDGSALTGIGFTTNVVTSNTTASKNNHYYLNGSSITLTLPSSPSVGDEVRISEVAGNTNNTIGRNSSNIMGAAEDLTIDTAYLVLSLRYVDSTIGWAFS